jgi:hypothetical protein
MLLHHRPRCRRTSERHPHPAAPGTLNVIRANNINVLQSILPERGVLGSLPRLLVTNITGPPRHAYFAPLDLISTQSVSSDSHGLQNKVLTGCGANHTSAISTDSRGSIYGSIEPTTATRLYEELVVFVSLSFIARVVHSAIVFVYS